MKWTAEQEQIIETRGCDLLVSAAAGSGKTAVLVERILRMLTDPEHPVSIDRLVIMTFTRAAAEEMRERIAAALRARIEAEPDNRSLRLQKAMLPRAKIATIDSICQNLIKQNYALLELDPGFRTADEGELKMMAGDAMEQILEAEYDRAEPDFSRFAEIYSGRSDERLRGLIEMLYRFIEADPWPRAYLAVQKDEAEAERTGTLSGLRWMRWLLDDVHGRAEEYRELFETARALCEEPGGPLPYLSGVEERLAAAERLSEAGDYDALYALLSKLSFSPLKAVRGEAFDPELKAQVKAVCGHFKDYVKSLCSGYAALPPELLRMAVQGTAPYIQVLLRLTEAYLARFEEIRREKNVVDFSDMEHLALRLLYTEQDGVMQPSALSDALSQRFSEILIDEYQDSNSLQEALLRAFSAERFGRPDVFMVGDVKQSIYRFRLARPELFMEKYERYRTLSASRADGSEEAVSASGTSENEEARPADSQQGDFLHVKIELNRNFRSRSEVLRSVNCLFFRLMQKKVGGVEYTEETALHPGAVFGEPEIPQDYKTELLLLDLADGEEKEDGEDAEAPEKAELEARMIAERILSLVWPSDGHPFMVTDRETGGFRPAALRDIVILLRAPGSAAEKLVDTLSACGIPAYTENASGYFNAVEVETMLAYLSIIDNPHQDIPLAAVLLSPAGGFSEGELAEIRAAFDKMREETLSPDSGDASFGVSDLFAALRFAADHAAERSNAADHAKDAANQMSDAAAGQSGSAADQLGAAALSPALRKKAGQFLSALQSLRERAEVLPVHRLLSALYRESGYYAYAGAMPMGKQRRKNLDMLLARAQSFAETSYSGIFNFVRYIEQIKKYDTDYGEASAVSEQDDLVRISSIHKSKGLEYSIVILAGLHRQFNRQDLKEAVLIDADLGIGSDYVDLDSHIRYPGLKKEVLKQKMLTENDGEELRVLYVAMTRAKEKLIMTAAVNDAEKKLQKWRSLGALLTKDGKLPKGVLLSAASLLDFVLMGMPLEHPDIELILKRPADIRAEEAARDTAGMERLRKLLSLSPDDTPDPAYAASLSASLCAVYPDPEDTMLPPKKTVSEIKMQRACAETGNKSECAGNATEAGHIKNAAETGYAEKALKQMHADMDFDDSAGDENAFLAACAEAEEAPILRFEELREGAEKGGALRGNAYHRVFQLIDFKLAGKQGASEAIAGLRRKGLLSEEEAALLDPVAIGRFLESGLGKSMAEAAERGRLYREQRFMIGLPAYELSPGTTSDTLQLLQGIIDAYFENEDGSLTLVDYKTDRLYGLSEKEAEAALLERYGVQLSLYRRALTQLLEKEVSRTCIYSTFLGREIDF